MRRAIARLAATTRLVLPACALLCACAAPPPATAEKPDPTQQEVRLPALSGWRASLVLEGDAGIWTAGAAKLLPRYGCPEVFALDDRGRLTVLVSDSGKWTPLSVLSDRAWLGAFAHLDLDPRRPGPEMYTGGQAGNLFQAVAHDLGGFDVALIARLPGEEIHTLLGGDLLPARPGLELLAFTGSGAVYDVRPGAEPGAGFHATLLARLEGRVRQAVLLPAEDGSAPWIAAACRTGRFLLLRMREDGFERRDLLEEPMGLGRVALRPACAPGAAVLYVTRDDGVLLRLEERPEGWRREAIYAGAQGLRGVAAGRFAADPALETVAVFGYCGRVQLLAPGPDGRWRAESLFVDRDKGHWLAALEIDGRNATDELIGCGYGQRVFALARPPGYGLEGVPLDPDEGGPASLQPELPGDLPP
ncbi:MAG: hypothetical protein HY812_09320 [Planctomycetes bacterium]|nr:hypothetical protein [Planctomycetota bacterium]